MTEPTDGDITRFFETETAQQNEAAIFEAESALVFEAIEAELNRCNIERIWHKDPVEASAASQRAFEKRLAGIVDRPIDEFDEVEADTFVRMKKITELMIVATIAMSLSVRDKVSDQAAILLNEEFTKKKLIANAQVNQLDEAWASAIDELLHGEPLDITREQDFEIYIAESQRIIDPQLPPTVRSINDIMIPLMEMSEDEEKARDISVTMLTLTHLFMSAQRHESKMPEAESAVYEAASKRLISAEHVAQLLKVLRTETE